MIEKTAFGRKERFKKKDDTDENENKQSNSKKPKISNDDKTFPTV